MSADILRQAASLIRERANATQPGPWVSSIEGRDHRGGDDVVLTGNDDIYVTVYHDRHASEEAQDHIASWHPVVALAVADWLDDVAWRSEHYPKQYRAAKHAAAVARAYLGSEADR